MPKIHINGSEHYYEQTGDGSSLVFIHGAFADSDIWEPQWQYFSTRHRLLRYDLRGHGKTGASDLSSYSMETFARDLSSLLEALDIRLPVICGLSWGGSIAQAFAVRNPERLKALVLVSSAVSIRLTIVEKLLCDVLFPRWAMELTIKTMKVEGFTRFSFFLARLTRGRDWLSHDRAAYEYLEQCMLRMNQSEYLKIWKAIYGFNILPLEKITCPTLILNGELEPKNAFDHTKEILRRVPQAKAEVIPAARHAMNLEQPGIFNEFVEKFVQQSA
jgi:pimeloyl-ACP methyl ester carboxylesterase